VAHRTCKINGNGRYGAYPHPAGKVASQAQNWVIGAAGNAHSSAEEWKVVGRAGVLPGEPQHSDGPFTTEDPCFVSVAAMPRDLPELRASYEDRDRVVETLRTAGGDGRLTAEELDARVERALSARTQGELAALVADLSPATATKDVLVVKQTGGKWTRAGRWTVPNRIEVRTKLCRVTFDFTDAVITSRTVRIDTDMQHGKLVIVGAPGIVIDADGLNLVFSKTRLCSDSAAADPVLRIELVGTLKHAKVVERRP
jgi:hypothetical protein